MGTFKFSKEGLLIPFNNRYNRGMQNHFQGLKIISFESRRAQEVEALISKYQGTAFSAPSMVEIPLEKNNAVFEFAEKLFHGGIDILILTTGVGTEILIETLHTKYKAENIQQSFQKIVLVARGPEPLAPLSKIRIKPNIVIPEPNTWHEIVTTLSNQNLIENRKIALQEYGTSNQELINALKEKGADVLPLPVYRWALPEDLGPLKKAINEIAEGTIDFILFMSAQQLQHVLQVARMIHKEKELREGMRRSVVASIGPLTSEALKRNDIAVDFVPSKSKMAVMIQELALAAKDLLKKN